MSLKYLTNFRKNIWLNLILLVIAGVLITHPTTLVSAQQHQEIGKYVCEISSQMHPVDKGPCTSTIDVLTSLAAPFNTSNVLANLLGLVWNLVLGVLMIIIGIICFIIIILSNGRVSFLFPLYFF